MKLTDDTFHIDQSANETVRGAKQEPEERAVARVMEIESEVRTGHPDADPNDAAPAVGTVPARIITQMTTEEAYAICGAHCGRCKHFDNEAWKQQYARLRNDPAEVEALNNIRAMYLFTEDPETIRRHSVHEGQVDPEHAITSMGLCGIYGRLCDPMATCITEVDGTKVAPKWVGRTPRIAAEVAMQREQLLAAANAASKK